MIWIWKHTTWKFCDFWTSSPFFCSQFSSVLKRVIPVAVTTLLYAHAKWHPLARKPFIERYPGDRGIHNVDDQIKEVWLYIFVPLWIRFYRRKESNCLYEIIVTTEWQHPRTVLKQSSGIMWEEEFVGCMRLQEEESGIGSCVAGGPKFKSLWWLIFWCENCHLFYNKYVMFILT